jgi:hypothetical protein
VLICDVGYEAGLPSDEQVSPPVDVDTLFFGHLLEAGHELLVAARLRESSIGLVSHLVEFHA